MRTNLIQGRLGARVIAQPVNYMQASRPEFDSQHPSMVAHVCNQSWGGKGKRIPRTYWLTSIAESVNPRSQ